ncbi:MAG: CotH kinase family protein, partial [Phaeodactylibacter sp.]|nr:CotH kinase family protein [Phaeodactylibacter sp.]
IYEEDGTLGAAFDGGVKIFGGYSRSNDQRSLSIFARGKYGFNEFDYPFFPDQPYDSYQAIVLRNSGNDWNNTMLRDAALNGLLKGADIERQAYRPVATYLNGEYWGIYNIREKINEHFLASKWNVDPEDIDLLELGGSVIYGNNEDFLQLVDFINTADLSVPANYYYVAGQMDLDNFALYQASQIYFDNTDWPGNNLKFGRKKEGRWRWILFDVDFGFGIWNSLNYTNNTLAFALEPNGPGWPNPPWSTLIFRKLTAQTTFRNLFVNRFADELNSRFLPERVSEHIDTLATRIANEIPVHLDRWGGSFGYWLNQVTNMKIFGNQRPGYIKGDILSAFGLPAYHQLTIEIENPEEGFVQVNSLTIKEAAWHGDYFQEVPICVKAIARPGYIFSHWIGSGNPGNTPELIIDMQSAMSLQPVFQSGTLEAIVINEINYNAADNFDPGDWIELYNP